MIKTIISPKYESSILILSDKIKFEFKMFACSEYNVTEYLFTLFLLLYNVAFSILSFYAFEIG